MEENKTTEFEQNPVEKLHPLLMLREIANKLVAIILVAIITMSCTYIGLYLTYQPEYQTRTTFIISVRNGASSVSANFSAAKGLASSFSQILGSDAMKRQIAKDLGVGEITGDIKANLVSETNILELTISASTPRDAYLITASLLNNYERVAGAALNNIILDVLQYPVVPQYPSNPLIVRKPVIVSGIISVLAMAAIICVMVYLKDTVKTVNDAEDKLDIKVLGIVPHENKYKTLKSKLKHRKSSILITNPTTGFDFVETFKKMRTKIDYSMRKKNFNTLMVTSVVENEGKSTIAINLALAMQKKYKNVLLIDADLKKSSIHKILNYQEAKYLTINDVLEGKATLQEALIKDKETGVFVLLGSNGIESSTELVSSLEMRELIEQAKISMDITIVDTPPMSVSPDAECIAENVDATILTVRQNFAPVRVVNDMVDTLNATKSLLLGCVLNDFRSADIDDSFKYGQSRYGYGKYGYGKYGYDNNTSNAGHNEEG